MLFHIREGGQNSWKPICLISGPFLVLHGGKWFYMIEQFIQWSHYTGYRPAISSCRTQYILALRFYVVYLCVSWLFDFCFVSYLCTPLFCGSCVWRTTCAIDPPVFALVCPIFVHLGFAACVWRTTCAIDPLVWPHWSPRAALDWSLSSSPDLLCT